MAQELVKAVAGMNKESEQIREMMQREMDNQEPWHKRALRPIRVQYPRVAKLLKLKADGTVYRYAFAWESSISECCVFFAEFFEHKKCWFGHP
jgi:hypothetical protein